MTRLVQLKRGQRQERTGRVDALRPTLRCADPNRLHAEPEGGRHPEGRELTLPRAGSSTMSSTPPSYSSGGLWQSARHCTSAVRVRKQGSPAAGWPPVKATA